MGQPLAGPFATLEAYCDQYLASLPPDARELACARVGGGLDRAPDEGVDTGPFAELAVLKLADGGAVSACALAIRDESGWFIGPKSADPCQEPSYIDIDGMRSSVDDRVVTIHVDVTWNTRDYEDEASYTLTGVCGVASDRPACTSIFTSRCDTRAPAGDCMTAGYELSWTVDDNVLELAAGGPAGDVVQQLVGKHRLF